MKNITLNITAIILILTLIVSCEANKHISVTVLDSITQKPIDSVFIKVKSGKNGDYNKNSSAGYTNTTGNFETYMMIGCAFGCYDIYMEYSKKGYADKIDFNVTEGKVFLIPE